MTPDLTKLVSYCCSLREQFAVAFRPNSGTALLCSTSLQIYWSRSHLLDIIRNSSCMQQQQHTPDGDAIECTLQCAIRRAKSLVWYASESEHLLPQNISRPPMWPSSTVNSFKYFPLSAALCEPLQDQVDQRLNL